MKDSPGNHVGEGREKYLSLAIDIFQGSLERSGRNLFEDVVVTEMARLLQEKASDKKEMDYLKKELNDLKEQRWKDLGALEASDRGSKFEEIKEKLNAMKDSPKSSGKTPGGQKTTSKQQEATPTNFSDMSNWFPGCECYSCRRLSAQNPRPPMSQHSNWPRPGSWVLLDDNRVVQLVYLGHDPHSRDSSVGVVVLESKGDVKPRFYPLSKVQRFNGQLYNDHDLRGRESMDDILTERSFHGNACCGHVCLHYCRSLRTTSCPEKQHGLGRKFSAPNLSSYPLTSDWSSTDSGFYGFDNVVHEKETLMKRLLRRIYSLI